MIKSGADRIGASASVKIVTGDKSGVSTVTSGFRFNCNFD